MLEFINKGNILLQVKLGTFSTVSAIVLTILASRVLYPEVNEIKAISPTVINFDQVVDEKSQKDLVAMLKAAEDEPVLLVLDSPGGAVKSEYDIIQAMSHNKQIDTYIGWMSASAAAQIWVHGHNRYVEKDSMVIFHSCQMAGFTPHELQQALDVLDGKLIDPALPNDGADHLKEIQLTVGGMTIPHLRRLLKSLIAVANLENEKTLDAFNDIIAASKGKLTREMIKHELFHDFIDDLPVTGQKLFDMGIATHLGQPNLKFYHTEGHL